MFIDCIFWDLEDEPDGNVQHLAEHGITIDEFKEVVLDPRNPVTASRSADNFITFGHTSTGKHIAAIWELISDEPRSIRPVTAFEAPTMRGG
ncbi:MAG: hypothetical protein B7Z73_00215 [Planctomycetia bacterium 21-64-5]|nr:MAG: hypothetical protein B7Z73_00215 [Planctomycetia bacterium 21-64-5]